MTFRFMGTGTSVGVPQIGCTCAVCTSRDPRDRRRRCGAYVTTEQGGFLIDTPPEMREAAIEYGVRRVDAVVLTHAHMDHVAGFDDVRRFNTINGTKVACDPNEPGANGLPFRIIGKPLTCYAMSETIEAMHRIFPYIGLKDNSEGLFRPQIGFDPAETFEIGGVRLTRFRVQHGYPCCGYLLEDATARLAYVSDCHEIPPEAIDLIRGVDALVVNCLRLRPHPTHQSLDQARAVVEAVGPTRAYLTHMCHDLSHAEWLARLAGTCIEPAYDGLTLAL